MNFYEHRVYIPLYVYIFRTLYAKHLEAVLANKEEW